MSRTKIRLIAAGITASALLLLSFFTPVAATASTGADGWIGFNTGSYPNGHQLGTYLPSGYSQRAVCIDISSPGNYMSPPSSRTGAVSNYDPTISWMLNAYSQSQDPAYTAALEYFVGLRINSNSAEIQNAWNELASYNSAHFAAAQAALNDMTAQAASYAGPYTGSIILEADARGWTGSVGPTIGVRPAGPGNTWPFVPYMAVTLTLTGPAVFNQTGTQTITGTTDGWGGLGSTSTAWHATAAGDIGIGEDVAGLSMNYTLYPAPGAGQQRMVTGAGTEPRHWDDPLGAMSITPTVSSHLQHQLANGTWADVTTVRVNEKVRDTIQVTNGLANTTVNLDWKAETSAQPFSASNPSGAIIDSGTVPIVLDANGAGSAVLPFTVPVDYSGHVGVDTFLHGSVANGVDDVDPPIFDNGESAPIVKWTPTMASQLQKPGAAVDTPWVNASTFMAGDKVRDVIVITGGAPNSPVTLDWALRTSDKAFSKTNLGTPVDGQSGTGIQIVLDASGSATYLLPTTTGSGDGYIGVDTYLHGLAQNADIDPPVWDANESGLVTLWKPAVTTMTSSIAVMSGKPISDHLKITGARPNTTFTCSATLYGPYDAQQAELPTVPADAVKAGTATCSGTTDADGNATVNTVALNAPAPGWYVWVGTLDAMKDAAGDPVAAPITEGFGIAAETSIVTVDTSGEVSAGGIDGGIPASMPGGDLVWVGVLSLTMVGLGFAGVMRLRKVRPGPRRAYGTD